MAQNDWWVNGWQPATMCADNAAVKAIAAGPGRYDGSLAVSLDTDKVWVFSAASSAADDATTVLQPTSGSGRWLQAGNASSFGAAGTATASKALVLDANKAVDVLAAKTSLSLGGTGIPGDATVCTNVTKSITGMADAGAVAVFTVTVPNAQCNAIIDLDFCGTLGAGGAIGAGESSRISKYQLVLARTAGVAVVATLSALIGGAVASVAGAASVSSVTATLSGITGGVGATNTFTINVAITRSGGSSTNHTLAAFASILNQNTGGVTIA